MPLFAIAHPDGLAVVVRGAVVSRPMRPSDALERVKQGSLIDDAEWHARASACELSTLWLNSTRPQRDSVRRELWRLFGPFMQDEDAGHA